MSDKRDEEQRAAGNKIADMQLHKEKRALMNIKKKVIDDIRTNGVPAGLTAAAVDELEKIINEGLRDNERRRSRRLRKGGFKPSPKT